MRLLNSLTDDRTLLGLIVWACICTFFGILLALVSLSPKWLIIVIAIASIPYIFGAAKETCGDSTSQRDR